KEGETVPVNSVVAVIGAAGEAASPPPGKLPEAAVGQPEVPASKPSAALSGSGNGVQPVESPGATSKEDLRRQKSSRLPRRIARDHNVDISQIHGTGISGRVTKHDILGYIESGKAAPEPAPRPMPQPGPAYRPGENVQIVPMSVMRRKIAEHMVLSA